MKKQLMSLVMGVVLTGALAQVAAGGLMFNNVDGAAGWVWVEAESMVSNSGFGPFWGGSGTSGWWNGGGSNSIADSFNPSNGNMTHTFTIPLAMANAKMYARDSGSYPDTWRWMNIYLGSGVTGTPVGTFSTAPGMALRESTPLGAFSAGDTTLTQEVGIYCEHRQDGFFIANAPIAETGLLNIGTWEWMNIPAFTGTLPTLDKPAFTPTVSGAPDGATYWMNGVQLTGTFGQINTPGTYTLAVKDSAGDVLAGVGFNYVPEPATMVLMAVSALGLLRRRK